MIALAVLVSVRPALQAQTPGEDGRDRGGEESRPAVSARSLPSEEMIAGPLSPSRAAELFQLDSVQRDRYQAVWDSLQRNTGTAREVARKQLETVRRAQAAGYLEVVSQERKRLDRMVGELRKEDGRFEKALRDFLTKEQQQAYSRWRKSLEAPPAEPGRGGERRRGRRPDGGE